MSTWKVWRAVLVVYYEVSISAWNRQKAVMRGKFLSDETRLVESLRNNGLSEN